MKTKHILIVEDESIVAFDLEMQLTSRGYTIVGVTGYAEDVPDFLEAHRIDLILMDIRLKGKITGIDMAKQIIDSTDIPIIFLTALSDMETQEVIQSLGVSGYVRKPFYSESLFQAIEKAFRCSV